MDDLASLELLSLVSKVTSELQNHLGINDKTLAEFVIAQHSQCQSLSDFQAKMEEVEAGMFPRSLLESVDRLIITMHPKHKGIANGHSTGAQVYGGGKMLDEVEKKTRIFKGLAVPDKEQQWEDEPLDSQVKAGPLTGALDDTFAMLEGLAGKGTNPLNGAKNRKRSRSPDDVDVGRIRRGKEKFRSRSRSLSRERLGRHRRDRGHSYNEEYSARTNGHRIKDSSYHDGRGGRKQGHRHDEDDVFMRPPTPEIDNALKIFKVYNGTVGGIKPFGVFVSLQGVKGKADGLVHVSAMQQGARVNDPSDLVSQGQSVKVKVVSIESGPKGPRIGLSMKEVDQVTGRDLIPQKRLASGANMERLDGMGPETNDNDRYGSLTSDVPVVEGEMNRKRMRQKKRMTSPERWEIKQLIASGAISALDYPEID